MKKEFSAYRQKGDSVESFLAPEFYYKDTMRKGDTTFAYVCYDERDSVINADTVRDFSDIHFLSLFKSFIDHFHTYRDNDGYKKPLPVSIIVERYDRLSPKRWSHISYPGNHYEELREFKDDIIMTDTFDYADPLSHTMIQKVYKHYKVALVH